MPLCYTPGMPSPELSHSFRESLANLPSFYQLKDRQDSESETMNQSRVVLSAGIDELNELTTPWGCPLVGLINQKGTYEIEAGAWYPYENDVKLLYPQYPISVGRKKIQVSDLGDGTIETSIWNAHVIRRELLGNPPLTVDDIELLYKRDLEIWKPEDAPFIGLKNDTPFGDFIENYPPIRDSHPDNDLEFWEESMRVILKPDFYMEIDRFIKRKGWITPSDALTPAALYHATTGFLYVPLESEWIVDVGFNFGGHLEENPNILETLDRYH